MLQNLITISIVAAATIIAGVRFINFFIHPGKKCEGCSSGCGGCPVNELKREIDSKKSTVPDITVHKKFPV